MTVLPPFPDYSYIDPKDNFALMADVVFHGENLLQANPKVRYSHISDGALTDALLHANLRGTATFTKAFQKLVQLHYLPECNYWLGMINSVCSDRHLIQVLDDKRLQELLHLFIKFCLDDQWQFGEQSIMAGWQSTPSPNELGSIIEGLKVSTALKLADLDVVSRLFPAPTEQ